MIYMPGESPQGPDGRRSEADRILKLLTDHVDELTERERGFVIQVQDGPVSPKQLFWLRDLKEHYAE